MKKILSSFLVLGFLISCSTTEQLAMKSLYSITSNQQEDIKGAMKMDSLLIFKKIGMNYNDVITLDKLTQNKTINYALTVHYIGPDWRYLEGILLKVDDTLFTLADPSPTRNVNRTSNVTVSERVTCVLNDTLIEAIKNASSINLQYHIDPVKIPQEGITAIKSFLE